MQSFCLALLTVAPLSLSATPAEPSLTQDPDTSKKKEDVKSVVQQKYFSPNEQGQHLLLRL